MTVESSTQAICDLALRFGEGDEESMVSLIYVPIASRTQEARLIICRLSCNHFMYRVVGVLMYLFVCAVTAIWSLPPNCWT